MTTLAPEKDVTQKPAPSEISSVARFELWGLQNWLLATVFLAPLALLWAHGALFLVGLGYAIVYLVLMIIPTLLNLLLLYDALRILVGRSATVLPWMLGTFIASIRRRQPQKAHPLVSLSVVVNPFTAAAGEFWALALRYRRNALQQIMEDANRLAVRIRPTAPQVFVVEMQEFSREVLDDAMCVGG